MQLLAVFRALAVQSVLATSLCGRLPARVRRPFRARSYLFCNTRWGVGQCARYVCERVQEYVALQKNWAELRPSFGGEPSFDGWADADAGLNFRSMCLRLRVCFCVCGDLVVCLIMSFHHHRLCCFLFARLQRHTFFLLLGCFRRHPPGFK